MSYKTEYIIWDVEDVQVGIPVGFDVELSQKLSFTPVIYSLNTYKENQTALGEGFEYSVDDGTTWLSYPLGETGMTFYSPFKMRLKLNAAYAGCLLLENNGIVYKIRSDGVATVETYDTGNRELISDIDMDEKNGILYLMGTSTIFRLNTKIQLSPYDNSLPISAEDDVLGIVVDGQRSSFWQINRKSVCLRDLYGEEQFCLPLPDIDVEWSSSSSSSSFSSSSSSSSSSSESSSSSSSIDSSSSSSSNSSSSSSSSSVSSGSSSSSSSLDSSSSSSGDNLIVTGSPSPNSTGNYSQYGYYDSHPTYRRDDGSFYIWFYYDRYICSIGVGQSTNYWSKALSSEDVTGFYNSIAGYFNPIWVNYT